MNFEDLIWCNDFESRADTLRLLKAIDVHLTEKGRQAQKDLEKWLNDNADKYFKLVSEYKKGLS